ncbi:protein FAR1-RELATED SEQUENCE 9-like [Humulus lupulus]|uniref:protein FAR1-RELATED SEQUENCE 9-like n=1 Tax=Humulus lupulus TaxID=3486 RepID=UPI002B401123|nr:protein FAR1-RELATED SEQUENCE 9-like [Humulus lupulus]
MYYKVADQIKAEHAYFVNNCEDNGESFSYSLSKFQHEDRVYNVHYHPQEETFTCHCLLFETDGYPCRHIWAVMKYRHMKIVPQSLLLKRWSKNAKADLPLELKQHSTEKQQLFEMARQASLALDTNLLSYYASKSEQSYTKAKQEVATLTAMFKDAVPLESNTVMPSNDAFDICASADAPPSRKKSSRKNLVEGSGEPSRKRARPEDPPTPIPSKSTPPPPPHTAPSTD